MADRFTIVGGRGFIGAAVADALRAGGDDVDIATHRDDFRERDLGHVIYASGIAASGAHDPEYAVASHVGAPAAILARARYASLLYLSSTRVYGTAQRTAEDAPLEARPEANDLYRITKIAGEATCLAHAHAGVRVARLSNIAGPSFTSPLFLSDVLRAAAMDGRARVRTLRASAKDYLTIDDACRYLIAIAKHGAERVYNVASGRNTENGAIFDALEAAGAPVEIAPDAVLALTPAIDARRLHREFGPPRQDIVTELPRLLQAFAAHAAANAPVA